MTDGLFFLLIVLLISRKKPQKITDFGKKLKQISSYIGPVFDGELGAYHSTREAKNTFWRQIGHSIGHRQRALTVMPTAW